jgi:pyruvate-ferredoxin/flavodoxin oxidoreductase
VLRGTAQNPDAFFQAREAVNPFYAACADITQKVMDEFYAQTGRRYNLFDYVGAPDAERVSWSDGLGLRGGAGTVDYLTWKGEKVGMVKVRCYRPLTASASWKRCRPRSKPSPCWTGPKNRAPRANRSTRMSSTALLRRAE